MGTDGYAVFNVSAARRADNEDALGVVACARQASRSAPDTRGPFEITLSPTISR